MVGLNTIGVLCLSDHWVLELTSAAGEARFPVEALPCWPSKDRFLKEKLAY